MLPRPVVLLLWRLLALACLLLAAIGVVLPGLPTVPFLLVAAWAGGHGWPALERWLLAHPRYGPGIRRWRERGVIPRRAKWAASLMMTASALVIVFLTPMPPWSKILVLGTMALVALWMWGRPER